MQKNLAFIGAGVVGTALAVILHERGWTVKAVSSRTEDSARRLSTLTGAVVFSEITPAVREGELIFLTAPDMVIAELGKQIQKSEEDLSGKVFFHCSGSLSSAVIAGLKERGALIASLHPLQSFARYETARANLPGSVFSFEGDSEAESLAREIVQSLDGEFIPIQTDDKVFYHAGACIISNYTVALTHAAFCLYREIGFTEEQSRRALLPLLQGTVNNLNSVSPAQALTGPIARGDWAVVEEHLQYLELLHPGITEIYKKMGKYTLSVALEKGNLTKEQAEQLEKILDEEES